MSIKERVYKQSELKSFMEETLGLKLVQIMSTLNLSKILMYYFWNECEAGFKLAAKGLKTLDKPLDIELHEDFATYFFSHCGYTDVEVGQLLGVPVETLVKWWGSQRRLTMQYIAHSIERKVPADPKWIPQFAAFIQMHSGMQSKKAINKLMVSKQVLASLFYAHPEALKLISIGVSAAPKDVYIYILSENLSRFTKSVGKATTSDICEFSKLPRKIMYQWWNNTETKSLAVFLTIGYKKACKDSD